MEKPFKRQQFWETASLLGEWNAFYLIGYFLVHSEFVDNWCISFNYRDDGGFEVVVESLVLPTGGFFGMMNLIESIDAMKHPLRSDHYVLQSMEAGGEHGCRMVFERKVNVSESSLLLGLKEPELGYVKITGGKAGVALTYQSFKESVDKLPKMDGFKIRKTEKDDKLYVYFRSPQRIIPIPLMHGNYMAIMSSREVYWVTSSSVRASEIPGMFAHCFTFNLVDDVFIAKSEFENHPS